VKKTFLTTIFTLFLVACGNVSNNDTNNYNASPNDNQNAQSNTLSESTNFGGELIFLQANSPNSFDPHLQNDGASAQANRSIYEGLTAFDADGNLTPLLAESWEMISDTVWQFNLRRGVVFHDGTPFNAYAVKTSFDRLLDPLAGHAGAFIIEMINETEIIDDYTIHLHLNFPFSPLPAHLAAMVALIISPTAIEIERNGGVLVRDNPVGTGPFSFYEMVAGEYTRFVAFDNHWRARPYIDSLLFRVVPDTTVRLLMVESGEAHASVASASDVTNINLSPTLNPFQTQGSNLTYIGFNTNIEPFNDIRVRQAMSMAINKDDFVYAIIEGQGIVARSPLSPLVAGSTIDLIQLDQNLEEAKTLLEQAGFPNGFGATIHTSNSEHSRIAELAQYQLAEIGIDLQIVQMEFGAFQDFTNNGNHELFVLGWTAFTGDADYGLYPLFHTSMHGAAGNRTFYSNPTVDSLLERARASSDQNYRNELYAQVQQILVTEAPMIYLYHPIATLAYNGIQGILQHPNIVPQFHEARILN